MASGTLGRHSFCRPEIFSDNAATTVLQWELPRRSVGPHGRAIQSPIQATHASVFTSGEPSGRKFIYQRPLDPVKFVRYRTRFDRLE